MNRPPLDEGLDACIDVALREDLGAGDATSNACVPEGAPGRAVIVAREPTVACALGVAWSCFERLDPGVAFEQRYADGDPVEAGSVLAVVSGRLRALLSAERVALNFMQRASGIAMATHACVAAVSGTGVEIRDTRKTAPGLRALDRLAVRAGGGRNHRFGLDSMLMVKDNHVAAAGSIAEALRCALAGAGTLEVEVEVDSREQLDELLAQPRLPDWVLLDNFTPELVREAVEVVDGRMLVEASGGITPATLRRYAEAAPDAISLGFLTHSVKAADVALDVVPA